jgi:hypothetical protein
MGVISESAVWEDSVLQIEVGDPVGGGPSAVANLQAQDLANRTKWLKENKLDASNFGEFYPTGVTPTYVDSTHFTVVGDQTAIFTRGRVLKITDTGGTFNAICATSAYDSGTELTTVTVAGDTIDSGISAVLYAVQQVTGQIWESGSNAQGEYVKFADGTMMCRWKSPFASITIPPLTTNGPHMWTFPAAFSTIASLVVFADYVGVHATSFSAGIASVLHAQIRIDVVNNDAETTLTSSPQDILVFLATGRWY